MKRLERVTTATWGDPDKGCLHIDVRELYAARRARGEKSIDPYVLALRALSQLRIMRPDLMLIAHVRGLPARFEARQ